MSFDGFLKHANVDMVKQYGILGFNGLCSKYDIDPNCSQLKALKDVFDRLYELGTQAELAEEGQIGWSQRISDRRKAEMRLKVHGEGGFPS